MPLDSFTFSVRTAAVMVQAVLCACSAWDFRAQADPVLFDPNLSVRHIVDANPGALRLARNPQDDSLFYMVANGDIYQFKPDPAQAPVKVYSTTDHHVSNLAGIAIGPDGSFYLTSNRRENSRTISTVTRGRLNSATQTRVWETLAETDPYPLSYTSHEMNGVLVSKDGNSLLVNIGARTDHGEVWDEGGQFPGLREAGLSASLLQLPITATNLKIPNDRNQLASQGLLFAEGLRNTFDLAYAGNGDLFGTDNGPDRDMSDELNWLQQGKHYGFPWKMGTDNNPQQFPGYDPSTDLLLSAVYQAVRLGTYHNDPTFPAPPGPFVDPVINSGPDADKYRDPVTGAIQDASDQGRTLSTFTAHRAPLGIVFDADNALGGGYAGDGFVLGWTRGDIASDPGNGPFFDSGQDLLHLDLTKVGAHYEGLVTQIAANFANPIDTALVDNKLYVLEFRGQRGIWEISFPENVPDSVSSLLMLGIGVFGLGLMRHR